MLVVGAEAGGFLLDLALQMAGIGGDPDRALVLLRPEAGGGEIAQGFAGAGAGFGQDEMRVALGHARLEGGGGGGGEIGLGGALLGAGAEQGGEPRAGLGGGDGEGGGRRAGGCILPFRQAFPQAHGHAVRRGGGCAQGREHEARPAPAGAA